MTNKQHRRQSHRNKQGKYAVVFPCNHCGKSAGLDYLSHHDTDKAINDELICLCQKCHSILDQMSGPEAVEFSKKARTP